MQPYDTSDLVAIIKHGLTSTTNPKKVMVVGAGIAGLAAAYELKRAGHDPIILECNARVGGRIHTLREPFMPGLYAEAGAMRIPRTHTLTMAYIEKFHLPISTFRMNNPQAYYYINGRKIRIAEADANPDLLCFDTAPHEKGKTAEQLWAQAIMPIVQQLENEGLGAWATIEKMYDRYSLREFLESKNWSPGAIELFGLLTDQEALMNYSFLELLREEIGNYYNDMIQIPGGMDQLPNAFLPELRNHIRFGAKMIAIDQSPDLVTIHYETSAGRRSITGDYAILAVPFPVLRHIEVFHPFSREKQRAIRQLHYDASAKILLQCKRRFWEEDEGIYGGSTITDLPIRTLFYPDLGRETGRGVLLASYTWSEDAQRWGSLSPEGRVEEAIDDLAQIHPQIIDEFEVGTSHIWHHGEASGGAFAIFEPEQQTLLYADIIKPEGRIHFAGEHASLTHTWIQGAIESGLRAAMEINHVSTLTN